METVRKLSGAANPVFILCLLGSFIVAWFYHDKFWWAPDDGYFGYIAQQMINGDILHKDIKVLHTGLQYFINVVLLQLSDGDLVGLRYPLILLTVVQTGFAFKLGQKFGILVAIAAAAITTAFSFILFVNPTPNWYTPTIAIMLAYILSRKDTTAAKTILLVGFLVGIAFMLRQLTGMILAMGVTAVIFTKNSSPDNQDRAFAGKILLFILAIGVSLYVFKVSRLTGFFLVGMYPPLIMAVCAKRCSLNLRQVGQTIGFLFLGAAISAIPVALYYVVNGALYDWLYGIFVAPLTFIEMPFFDTQTYFWLPGWALRTLADGNWIGLYGLYFWLSLIFTPMFLGIIVIRRLARKNAQLPVIGIIGSFYGLVAIHFETFGYLTFAIAPVLIGLLLTLSSKKMRSLFAVHALLLSTIAIHGHAAQSYERGWVKLATNIPFKYQPVEIPKTTINYTPREREKYIAILNVIETCTEKSDKIFALPMNPELYFLSNRKSAFEFFTAYIGFTTRDDLARSLKIIESEQAPALIIHKEDDKYNSALGLELLEKAKPRYKILGQISEWTVYLHTSLNIPADCSAIQSKKVGIND